MSKSDLRRDFAADARLLGIAAATAVIGVLSTVAASALLQLIQLFTHLFFFHSWSTAAVSPAHNTLGLWVIPVPIAGALIIGLMARFGSEKIRGHGIPEAIEAILFGKSKMSLKVALLKPLSSGIAIGSGGPFGAEGPIIMTGGAIGSLLGQYLHITGSERKTLLVAGAVAGMTAIFGTPIAAVMLAVELLLFELRPRSLIPVAVSCAVAAFARPYLFDVGPLFYKADQRQHFQAIDALFRGTINWDLIREQYPQFMQLAIGIQTGKLTPSAVLARLNSYSTRNRFCLALQELGKSVRTTFLLQWVWDQPLRHSVHKCTTKIERHHHFSKYLYFGGEGLRTNDLADQEKAIVYNELITNAVALQNVVDQTQALHQLRAEGVEFRAEDAAFLSPYGTSKWKRFGDYRTSYDPEPLGHRTLPG